MHASHALRSFLTASQSQKRSTAILYLDVKSAYYRVIRQLASNLALAEVMSLRLRLAVLEQCKAYGNLLSL